MLDEKRIRELARTYRQLGDLLPTENSRMVYRERAVALECVLAEPAPSDNSESSTVTVLLLLGNGVSRLQYIQEIKGWQGELWGSNFVYAEYGRQLTRINGHADVMEQAESWKRTHRYNYRVITDADITGLPEQLRGNSGISLIAQALNEGCYDKIILCGFDFGGKDVWTPVMDKRDVESGLRDRWKVLLETYPEAPEKIQFWPICPGYDILSEEYRAFFFMEAQHTERLNKELQRLSDMEVLSPPFEAVTEATRGAEFYQDLLRGGR